MHDSVLTLHPKRSLTITGFVSFLALTIPIFGVLYWETAAEGVWPWLLAIHLGIAALCFLTFLRQRLVFVSVTPKTLIGNGIFSRVVTVPRTEIRRVVFARLYARDSSDTSIQFLAVDKAGRCLFRMRGQYWHESDLRILVAALNVGDAIDTEPLSSSELFAAYPGSRYWFERSR